MNLQNGDVVWMQGNHSGGWKLVQAEFLGTASQQYVLVRILYNYPLKTKVHPSRLHLTKRGAYEATLAELQARKASVVDHMAQLTESFEQEGESK